MGWNIKLKDTNYYVLSGRTESQEKGGGTDNTTNIFVTLIFFFLALSYYFCDVFKDHEKSFALGPSKKLQHGDFCAPGGLTVQSWRMK